MTSSSQGKAITPRAHHSTQDAAKDVATSVANAALSTTDELETELEQEVEAIFLKAEQILASEHTNLDLVSSAEVSWEMPNLCRPSCISLDAEAEALLEAMDSNESLAEESLCLGQNLAVQEGSDLHGTQPPQLRPQLEPTSTTNQEALERELATILDCSDPSRDQNGKRNVRHCKHFSTGCSRIKRG